jgi:hypothetical protein
MKIKLNLQYLYRRLVSQAPFKSFYFPYYCQPPESQKPLIKSLSISHTDSIPCIPDKFTKKTSQNALLSPPEDLTDKPSRELSKFVLRITTNLKRNLRRVLQSEQVSLSDELILLTGRHLKAYFGNALSIEIVAVMLTSLHSDYSSSYLIEDIGGTVYFAENDVLPTVSALNFLVEQAFHGSSLDDFLAILQETSGSSALRNALYAEIVLDDTVLALPAKKSFFGDFKWTTPWIVIAAATGVALFATLFLILFLLKARSQRVMKVSGTKCKTSGTPRTQILKNDFVEDLNSDDRSAQASDLTSVFSYRQQDDIVSLAPSFQHAFSDRSALGAFYGTESDDDSIKTPTSLISQGMSEDDYSFHQEKKSRPVKGPKSNCKISTVSQKYRGISRERNNENESVQSSTFDEAYDASSDAGDTTVDDESSAACFKSKSGQEFSHLWDDDSQKLEGPTFVDLDQSDDDL